MAERLISAESHVKITHDQVKEHLPSHLHRFYDEAAQGYDARMSRGTGAVNRARRGGKCPEEGSDSHRSVEQCLHARWLLEPRRTPEGHGHRWRRR